MNIPIKGVSPTRLFTGEEMNEIWKELEKIGFDKRFIDAFWYYLASFSPAKQRTDSTIKEILADLRVNIKMAPVWAGYWEKVRLPKGFSITPISQLTPKNGLHPEALHFISIKKEEEQIATIGCNFGRVGKGIVVWIRNIQGVKGKENELSELKELIGENWRVFLTKKIMEFAEKKHLIIRGSAKPYVGLAGPEKERKVRKQLIHTYRKAGLKPKPQATFFEKSFQKRIRP